MKNNRITNRQFALNFTQNVYNVIHEYAARLDERSLIGYCEYNTIYRNIFKYGIGGNSRDLYVNPKTGIRYDGLYDLNTIAKYGDYRTEMFCGNAKQYAIDHNVAVFQYKQSIGEYTRLLDHIFQSGLLVINDANIDKMSINTLQRFILDCLLAVGNFKHVK